MSVLQRDEGNEDELPPMLMITLMVQGNYVKIGGITRELLRRHLAQPSPTLALMESSERARWQTWT